MFVYKLSITRIEKIYIFPKALFKILELKAKLKK